MLRRMQSIHLLLGFVALFLVLSANSRIITKEAEEAHSASVVSEADASLSTNNNNNNNNNKSPEETTVGKTQDDITSSARRTSEWPLLPVLQDSSSSSHFALGEEEDDGDDESWSSSSLSLFLGKNESDKKPPCKTYSSCTSCSDASWCHWCDKDSACHAMGSWYGCSIGSNCQPKPPSPPHDKNDTSGCALHSTCADCALHSHLCHWCGADNACHRIGSVYGCVTGVDCYSNDRCKRQYPEPIDAVVFTKMGMLPLSILAILAMTAFSCSSLCFCVAGGIKGAYDDLADLAMESTPPAPRTTTTTPASPLLHQAPTSPSTTTNTTNTNNVDDSPPANETPALVDTEQGDGHGEDEYVRLVEGSDHDEDEYPHRHHLHHDGHSIQSSSRRRPMHMQRLYNACVACYLVSLAGIGLFVYSGVRYYPKIPEYNICNDSVAWKSLIESITSMKVTADFEILASISNPNHFDIVLDTGRGSFTHNRAFVGTFSIPPVTAAAMSITDMLIVASFSPEKWDALALSAEYYRGTLVIDVDTQATIRIPALANYKYAANLKDIEVHVNELSDRHLCACPNWSDAKNQSKTTPRAVIGEPGLVELPILAEEEEE